MTVLSCSPMFQAKGAASSSTTAPRVEIKGGGAVNPAEFFVELLNEARDLISSLSQGRYFPPE